MHVTGELVRNNVAGLLFLGFCIYFAGWLFRNIPGKGGRQLGGLMIITSIIVLASIVVYDVTYK